MRPRHVRNTDVLNSLSELWERQGSSSRHALIAMGSLARMEAAPYSDLDIAILQAGEEKASVEHRIRALQSELPRLSLVVRQTGSTAALFDEDPRSWVALLEARLIAGQKDLYEQLIEELRTFAISHAAGIVHTLRKQIDRRHEQYGHAVSLLEPNIKNSAGALRDMQALYYLGCIVLLISRRPWEQPPDFHEAVSVLGFRHERQSVLESAQGFFLDIRDVMHMIRKHLHDYLDFDLQRETAELLGYGPRDERDSVERFMRRYYLHAAEIHTSLNFALDSVDRGTADEEETGYSERHGNVLEWNGTTEPSAEDIMQAYVEACSSGAVLSTSFRRIIDEADGDFTTSACAVLFDGIMRHRTNAGHTLRLMNESRILGKVLPEFRHMEHFFQHNIYHFYTADEHTITAIERCQRFDEEQGYLADVYRDVEDVSVLTYALLLHDIAKPVDVTRHELIGADMTQRILQRYGRGDIVESVRFLVRRHLSMEQLAFRRNFHDDATLRDFCSMVETQGMLDMLLLLTVSDMSALNPRVLTDWKKTLLMELHREATTMLAAGDIATVSDAPPQHGMENDEDIGECIARVRGGTSVCVNITREETLSIVTVVCVDAPQVLSRIAAALLSVDAAIVDARVETLHGGVVLDRFRVIDIIGEGALRDTQVQTLHDVLQGMWDGRVMAPEAFQRHRNKWKRKIRRQQTGDTLTRVDYVDHASAEGIEQTIIDVFAPDSLGLLYKLTETISAHGLNIIFAKIATRVDGVVDSFYVTDSRGMPFTDATARRLLRETLMKEIALLTHRG